MITLDQEKHNKIDKYLSKFEITVTSGLGLFTCLVTYVFLFIFAEKMSFIPLAEMKERLARKKVECMEEWTDNPNSHPGGLITKGSKSHVEGDALNKSLPSKTLNKRGSSSPAPEDNATVVLEEDISGEHSSPFKDDP